jgi:D-alanyl-D-alanine carboxypeptidase/D-alanyl-D-alanine-endopeptidase (penicillin-binding protein 4)
MLFLTLCAWHLSTTPVEKELHSLLQSPHLKKAHTGLYVHNLTQNTPVFSHHAQDLFIPASTAKTATTAAALSLLKPHYTFKTEVYANLDAQGTVHGNITFKGYGDPSLVPERVWYMVNRLKHLGVRAVEGDVVVDEGYFEGTRYAEGLEEDVSDAAYMAPAGALSVGFNTLTVHVRPHEKNGQPAHITLDPMSHYATLTGHITTSERHKTSFKVGVSPIKDRCLVRVSGVINIHDKERMVWRKIEHPSLYAGYILKEFLLKEGIEVRGHVRVVSETSQDPLIYTYTSPPLSEIVGGLNKFSNNFVANQIAFVLGAELFGAPATWEKGQRAISGFLENAVGIPPTAYVLSNASGLHSVNKMAPAQLVQILAYMHRNVSAGPEFVASLSVAGYSGTLRKRMQNTAAEGNMRAKTGTLSQATALAGYITNQDGDVLAFAFIVNKQHAHAQHIHALQDSLGEILGNHKETPTFK